MTLKTLVIAYMLSSNMVYAMYPGANKQIMLKRGMSETEVVNLLGQPDVVELPAWSKNGTRYKYGSSLNYYTVDFVDNLLVSTSRD